MKAESFPHLLHSWVDFTSTGPLPPPSCFTVIVPLHPEHSCLAFLSMNEAAFFSSPVSLIVLQSVQAITTLPRLCSDLPPEDDWRYGSKELAASPGRRQS